MISKRAALETMQRVKQLRLTTATSAGIIWSNLTMDGKELARVGLARRAVRLLYAERDSRTPPPQWYPEGQYATGRESVFLRWTRTSEDKLMWRDERGVWQIDEDIYAKLGGVRGESGEKLTSRDFLVQLM